MSKLPLTFACGLYDRMLALQTREVVPEGIDLDFIAIDEPRKIFDQMVTHRAYDASEMSASEHVAMVASGNSAFVGIPAFPSRVFRHSFIFVNTKRIRKPKDLEGKRVGVPLYGMTAALYIRGLLQDEYGVNLATIQWWPYGVEPNRPTLEALVRYMADQGLIAKRMPIKDLFVRSRT